jgi:uncharacterized membrane protein
MSSPAPSHAAAAPAPAARGDRRIVGIDLARGIALLGMAATHMLMVTDDEGYLTPVGLVFAGRSSALFALLAGVSLAVVSGGTAPRRGRDRARVSTSIAIRAVLIGLLGLVLVEAGAPVAVILTYYAVLFVLALPFLGLHAGPLALLAGAWAVLAPLVSHLVRPEFPPGPGEQVGLEVLLTDPGTAVVRLLLTGYYPVLVWLAYVLAGLAVGRSDLRERATALRLLIGGLALAATAWIVSTVLLAAGPARVLDPDGTAGLDGWGAAWWLQNGEAYGTVPTGDWRWLLVAAAHTGTPFDLLHTIGTSLAVLGACLLITRSDLVRRLARPVAAVGSMTLTLYTVHVLLLVSEVGTWGEPAYYWAQVVGALVVAPLWLWRFRRGPLEQLVHAISHDIARAAVPPPRALKGGQAP